MEFMKSDAYRDRNHPEHQKVQEIVAQGFENMYPDDDRNENPEEYYMWYAMSDDKTRSEHAKRHGKVYNWNKPPEGGHPGEAQSLALPYRPLISKESKRKKLDEEIHEIQRQIDFKNADIQKFERFINDVNVEYNRIKSISFNKTLKSAKDGFLEGYKGSNDELGFIPFWKAIFYL